MALTLDPQTQDYGDVNAAPNINVAVKESDNLDIEGEARIIDGSGTTVKTETWKGTGKYTYTPNFSDKWEDMAEGASSVQLTVKSYEPIPEEPVYADKYNLYLTPDTFDFDGDIKAPSLHGFDSNKMRMSGTTYAIDPGTYTIIVRLKQGYYWVNPQGTSDPHGELKLTWKINKGSGYIVINGTKLYNGYSYNLTINNTDTWNTFYISYLGSTPPRLKSFPNSSILGVRFNSGNDMEVLGYKNGNTTYRIYTPDSDIASEVIVTIYATVSAVQTINTLPTQSNYLYSDGYSYQFPTWDNYDSSQLDYYADWAIYPGEYNAYFTPKSGYQWYDGTTSTKNVKWYIREAYTPPAPVYTNPVSVDQSYVTVSWADNIYAYVTISNNTSKTARIRAIGSSGYGPFGTFDIYATSPAWVSDDTDISAYGTATLKILAGSGPELLRRMGSDPNNSYIRLECWDPDKGYPAGDLGDVTIHVTIVS